MRRWHWWIVRCSREIAGENHHADIPILWCAIDAEVVFRKPPLKVSNGSRAFFQSYAASFVEFDNEVEIGGLSTPVAR